MKVHKVEFVSLQSHTVLKLTYILQSYSVIFIHKNIRILHFMLHSRHFEYK